MTALACWTMPLAAVVGFVVLVFNRVTRNWNVIAQYVISLLLSYIVGISWTISVMILLGGMFYAFSFPVNLCWLYGSLAGLLVAVAFQHPRTWYISPILFVAALALVFMLNSSISPVQVKRAQPHFIVYFKPGCHQ